MSHILNHSISCFYVQLFKSLKSLERHLFRKLELFVS